MQKQAMKNGNVGSRQVLVQPQQQDAVLYVDLFCGGGGSTTGALQAMAEVGMFGNRSDEKVIAVNHDPQALATHAKNHPNVEHKDCDIEKLEPKDVLQGRKVKVVWASAPCFVAGTLILTADGPTPIEDVRQGDLVLTHLGRWRKVTATMVSRKATVCVSGHGHFGLETTAEHPFYARKSQRRWMNERRCYERVFGDAEWIEAGKLEPKIDYWATPIVAETLPMPSVGGRGLEFSSAFWWFVGYWLAEGTVRSERSGGRLTRVVLHAGDEAADEVEKRLRFAKKTGGRARRGEIHFTRNSQRTATRFQAMHSGLAEWLVSNFGRWSHGKRVPGWVLGMREAWRRALLEGYLFGDGTKKNPADSTPSTHVNTVSKALAVGVRLLAESLGYCVGITREASRPGQIEGRSFMSAPLYQLGWRDHGRHKVRKLGMSDDRHDWTVVRSVSSAQAAANVYNISVEEDESYVADGIVVHNCQDWSNAAAGECKVPQKRATPDYILQWIRVGEPEVYIEENVWEITTRWPRWKEHVKEIESLGYRVEYRKLNAADYGEAQDRRRLILLAVRDDKPIVWPRPTHSDPRKPIPGTKPWRGAIEILDLDLPCPSIFARKKRDGSPWPHSARTRARIARYLRELGTFWEPVAQAVMEFSGPVSLVEALAQCPRDEWPEWIWSCGDHLHLERPDPFVRYATHGGRTRDAGRPMPTVTCANRGELQVVQPFVDKRYGTGRAHGVEKPMGTVTTSGTHHAVVNPFLKEETVSQLETAFIDFYGGQDTWLARTKGLERPLGAVTGSGRWGVVAAQAVLPKRGRRGGLHSNQARGPERPMPTVMANGGNGHIIEGRVTAGAPVVLPHHGEAPGQKPRIHPSELPAPTVPASRALDFALPLLVYTYNGQANIQQATQPCTTLTTVERHAVLQVRVTELVLDVGMRMCTPRELARAQGFPEDYEFMGELKADVTRQIGNAVPVRLARAVLRAQLARQGLVRTRLGDFHSDVDVGVAA